MTGAAALGDGLLPGLGPDDVAITFYCDGTPPERHRHDPARLDRIHQATKDGHLTGMPRSAANSVTVTQGCTCASPPPGQGSPHVHVVWSPAPCPACGRRIPDKSLADITRALSAIAALPAGRPRQVDHRIGST